MLEDNVALLAEPANVDTGAPDKDRAAQFWDLAKATTAELDSTKPPDQRDNIQRFLLHVTWHKRVRG